MNSNDIMFSTPSPHPVVHSSELQIRNSSIATTSRSRSSSFGENNRASAAKRALEFAKIPYQKLHDLFVCPLDLGVSLGSLADYQHEIGTLIWKLHPVILRVVTFFRQ